MSAARDGAEDQRPAASGLTPAGAALDAARLRAVVECADIGVIAGRGDLILEANDRFLELVGRTRADLAAGLDWREMTPAHQRPPADVLSAPLRPGGSRSLFKDFVRPDGTVVPVRLVGGLVEPGTEEWFTLVMDRSEHQRLREVAGTEAAIARTMLDSAPVGFALFDAELRFERVNARMAEMNGFSVADHLGRGVFELLPQLRESAESLLRHVLETGEPLVDVEIAGETPAEPGVERHWMESFFAVRREDGESIGVAAVATDITERKRLERELQAAQRMLEDRLHVQGNALAELQRMLLPEIPVVDGVEIAARYLAAERIALVGGDWYDVFAAPGGRVVVAVGDATGHGLPAVTTMDLVRNVLRGQLLVGASLAEALAHASTALGAASTDVASVALVCLDPASGELEYALAGHPPPVVHRADGTTEVLPVGLGTLLGPLPADHRSHHARLAPGDRLALYTDGLVERRGDTTIDDGIVRLAAALAGHAGIDGVIGQVLGTPAEDDACLLVVTKR